jgi:hypothetical protein
VNPKYIAGFGLLCLAASLAWLGSILSADVPLWQLLFPIALLGLANAGIWAPLATSATRNLPPRLAGAGSGVYNTTRQMGAVLGSAGIAALMQSRLAAELPGFTEGGGAGEGAGSGNTVLPEALQAGFSAAMGQSLLLPAVVAVLGALAVAFFAAPKKVNGWTAQQQAQDAEAAETGPTPVAAD